MAIPIVTKDFIPTLQQTDIKRLSGGIDDTALTAKVLELQTAAEGFVKAYVGDTTNVDTTSWTEIKKLYIEWTIYSQLEIEKISIDKKDTLMQMLKQVSKRMNGKDEDKPSAGASVPVYIL